MLKPLTVAQLKEVRVLIDEAVQRNDVDLQQTEKERNNALREIGNHLHDSVPVSNDEVSIDLCYCISASCCINVLLVHFYFCLNATLLTIILLCNCKS
jgi:hypothetical protein